MDEHLSKLKESRKGVTLEALSVMLWDTQMMCRRNAQHFIVLKLCLLLLMSLATF